MDLLNYLGAKTEEQTPRHGVLSSRREWHSLLIGTSVGFVTAVSGGKDAAWMFIILTGIALGGKEVNTKHLQHVQKEPVYALAASVVAFVISAFVIIPLLP